jgi:dipeptidyl aminopeptidase/acylaminoacyl peptidase
VLLVHSQDDGYVVPANMDRIYAALTNTPDKTMLYVKGSGHVVTRDAARQEVFEAAAKFILRVESGSK